MFVKITSSTTWRPGFASGGIEESGKISWRVKYENLNFKKLQDLLFDIDYDDFYAGEYTKNGDLIDTKFDIEYFPAYGYCMRVT